MSTHSLIGIENSNGSVTFSFCHYDGYITGVGRELVEGYTTRKKARTMIEKGDMDAPGNHYESSTAKPVTASSAKNYREGMRQYCGEYAYLMKKSGAWVVSVDGEPFQSLKGALKQEGTLR